MGRNDGKPRGRMSSYAFFVQTCREEHKKKHPNDTVVFTEFTKKCAEKWKVLDFHENSYLKFDCHLLDLLIVCVVNAFMFPCFSV